MNATHTPGPWKALIDWPTAVFPGHLIKETGGVERPIALIPRGGNDRSVADAHLIAAAPETKAQRDELLAAIKNLQRWAVQISGRCLLPELPGDEELIDQVASAIAKAEGRA